MTIKRLLGSLPSQVSRNKDLGTMAFQDVSSVKGPCFSARRITSQTLSALTWTKAAINSKDFDTHNCFDTTTYRFTPTMAGYYQINCSAFFPANGGAVSINRSGTEWKTCGWGSGNTVFVGGNIYLNGSTDYVEMLIYLPSGQTATTATNFAFFFDGSFIRGA